MDRTNYEDHRVTRSRSLVRVGWSAQRTAHTTQPYELAGGGVGWRYFGQDSSCQATWRQTSDRQSTAVSPVRPLANRHLTVSFCPRSRFIIIYCDTVTLITQFISLETLLFLQLASTCRRETLRVLCGHSQLRTSSGLAWLFRTMATMLTAYVEWEYLKVYTTSRNAFKNSH